MYYFIVVKDNTLLWLDLSTSAFYNLLIVVVVVVVAVAVFSFLNFSFVFFKAKNRNNCFYHIS